MLQFGMSNATTFITAVHVELVDGWIDRRIKVHHQEPAVVPRWE